MNRRSVVLISEWRVAAGQWEALAGDQYALGIGVTWLRGEPVDRQLHSVHRAHRHVDRRRLLLACGCDRLMAQYWRRSVPWVEQVYCNENSAGHGPAVGELWFRGSEFVELYGIRRFWH